MVSLNELLARYLLKTDAQPCGRQRRAAAKQHILPWWGDALVTDLTMARQRQFIDHLSAKGFSPSFIKLIMGIISATLGHAVENDMLIFRQPVMMALGKIAERINKPERPTLRRLTIPELAAFIDAIESPHQFRYVMLALNTLARPAAIVELRWVQVADGLLHLNPAGRRQTKKYRPALPITDTLAAWLDVWRDKRQWLVHFHGKKVDTTGASMKGIAERSGLITEADYVIVDGKKTLPVERSIHPYTFRRSMARILRGRGVSMEDLGAWMGHRVPNAVTTEVFYADAAPEYLASVRAAIDGVMTEIGAHLKVTPIRPAPVDVDAFWFGEKKLYGSI